MVVKPSLQLVKNGMTEAVIFSPAGKNLQAADVLYKKNILAIRGSFRPVTRVSIDMLERALAQFCKESKMKIVIPLERKKKGQPKYVLRGGGWDPLGAQVRFFCDFRCIWGTLLGGARHPFGSLGRQKGTQS